MPFWPSGQSRKQIVPRPLSWVDPYTMYGRDTTADVAQIAAITPTILCAGIRGLRGWIIAIYLQINAQMYLLCSTFPDELPGVTAHCRSSAIMPRVTSRGFMAIPAARYASKNGQADRTLPLMGATERSSLMSREKKRTQYLY